MIRAKLNALSVEELANTITHGFGLALSVIGFVVLVILAGMRGDRLSIIGCVIYGLSLVILYAASTIYHSTTSLKLKHRMQIADHCGIYLLIAGSYTPFGLLIIQGSLGQELLVAIWAFAAVGIIAKLILHDRYPAISVVSYVIMGWLGVFAIQPLIEAIGPAAAPTRAWARVEQRARGPLETVPRDPRPGPGSSRALPSVDRR